ncbi:hypothetical protein GCM10020001_082110 [Nonomuraea salmonea]
MGGEPDDPPQRLLHQLQDGTGEVQERLGLVAGGQGGRAEHDAEEDDLEDLHLGEGGDDVRGQDAGDEVEPGAGVLGRLGRAGVEGDALAGVDEQAEPDRQRHRDGRGDEEPDQRLGGEPGGAVDVAQVGHADQDRGEDEWRYGELEQLDEDRADLGECLGEPGDVPDLGDEAEGDADGEAQQQLQGEGESLHGGCLRMRACQRHAGVRELTTGTRAASATERSVQPAQIDVQPLDEPHDHHGKPHSPA